jgi:zinc protease
MSFYKSLAISFTLAAEVFAQNSPTQVRPPVTVPSYKDLKFAPLPPLKIPQPESFTLPNGLKIFLLEDHELPLVNGFALVRTGNLFDPPDKRGLAGLTGEVLRSGGTRTKTGDQIDVQLETVAASVESQIGESYGTLSFNCLKENTPEVLGVFKDLLTNPEFRQDKVDLSKTQLRSGIARRNDDASGIADREFSDIVYGRNTPYGWMIEYADVNNIQRQDMVNFYQRFYFPSNILVAVYGDFNSAAMKEQLTKLFSDWTVKQPPVPKFPVVVDKAAPGVFLATKEDVTQTFFQVGHLSGELIDKDYPALEVAAEILGGGFSSRLFKLIRTKLGYAYNVGADWGANYDHPGIFRISGSTQSVHTVDTLKAVRQELDRIREAPVTDQELQTAKDTILNGFVFNFDRPSKTLNRLMIYEYFGYPKDFVFQYQRAIAGVTKADVLRVAKEHFRPQDMTIVAVGNPQAFKEPLSDLGSKVEAIDLTIPEPKKESAKADPASLEKGKQLLQQVQKAIGGADQLAQIIDLQYRAESSIETPGATITVKQFNSFALPSTMRQELELPFGKQTVYSNGTSGWLASTMPGQGQMALTPPVLKQAQGEVFRQLFRLALSDRDSNRTVALVGNAVIEIADKSGDSVRLQVDEKTGLPSKVLYQGAAMGGPPQEIEEAYADWREVAGVRLPFQWTIVQGGKKFGEVKVDEYKINSGLTDEELSKKP